MNPSASSIKANTDKRLFSTLIDKESNINIVDEKITILFRIRSGIDLSNYLEIYEHIMCNPF